MDHDALNALLRREGVGADQLDALMAWARERAKVLTTELDSSSAPAMSRSRIEKSLARGVRAKPSTKESIASKLGLDTSRTRRDHVVPSPASRYAAAAEFRAAREPVPLHGALAELAGEDEDELPEEAFLDDAFALLADSEEKGAVESTEDELNDNIELLDQEVLELVDDADLEFEEAPSEPQSDGVPAWKAALASAELAVEPTASRRSTRRSLSKRDATSSR